MQVLHQFLRLNTLLRRDIVEYVVYIGRVYIIFVVKASRLVYYQREDLITIYVNYEISQFVNEYHFKCFILFLATLANFVIEYRYKILLFEFSLVTQS